MNGMTYTTYSAAKTIAGRISVDGIVSKQDVVALETALGHDYPDYMPSSKEFTTVPSGTGAKALSVSIERMCGEYEKHVTSKNDTSTLMSTIDRALFIRGIIDRTTIDRAAVDVLLEARNEEGDLYANMPINSVLEESEVLMRFVGCDDQIVDAKIKHAFLKHDGVYPSLINAIKGRYLMQETTSSRFNMATFGDLVTMVTNGTIVSAMAEVVKKSRKHLLMNTLKEEMFDDKNAHFYLLSSAVDREHLLGDEASIDYITIVANLVKAKETFVNQ